MVNFCACFGCSNRRDRNKDKSFFRLPAVISHQGEQTRLLSERRRRQWLAAIRREDIKLENYKYTRICSDHFLSGKPSELYDDKNPDWVPSVNLGHNEMRCDPERYERAKRREAKRRKLNEEHEQNEEREQDQELDEEQDGSSDHETGTSVQTDVTLKDMAALELNISCFKSQIEEMKKRSLSQECFEKSDMLVNFYTGLPNWEIFSLLFAFVNQDLMTKSSLTPFHQLLCTLMRLRLGLCLQDLAYRFGVHQSTISRSFSYIIDVLYVKLQPLIIWPEREILLSTMPMCFRKHCPSCTVIIDCFEIFLDRPTNLLARAQTYSTYKHHNTIKYLIGVTPQGTVSYISQGWGGRVSDKYLTENCNILSYLQPGDTILADRGFDIQESAAMYCARVTMPSFTKGKKQLTGIEVEQTRRIANVRIHVERIIGLIRQKYSLLRDTIPIDYVHSTSNSTPLLDKIVVVCCALINLCESVIPYE